MKHNRVHWGSIVLAASSLLLLAACGKPSPTPAPPPAAAPELGTEEQAEVDKLLVEAVEQGDKDAVKKHLKAGGNPMAMTPVGPLPSLAAVGGNADVIGLLGASGANFNALDINGQAPIHLAAGGGHTDAVAQMLDLGVDVNSLGGTATLGTPLNSAVGGGHLETVNLLLGRGADVNLAGAGSGTPLMTAADLGSIDMTQLLLGNGADPNIQGPLGYTPLHFAAENNDQAMSQLLLNSGADHTLPTVDGQLPFDLGNLLPDLGTGDPLEALPDMGGLDIEGVIPDLGGD